MIGLASFSGLNMQAQTGHSRSGSLGNQSGTFDFAQIQVERGSTATDFETEYYSETLRKCQRYYYEYPKGETYSFIGTGFSS